MKGAKVVPVVVVVACTLVIIAFTPSTLTDPLVKALSQIRQNTMRSEKPSVPSLNGEQPSQVETSEQKNLK